MDKIIITSMRQNAGKTSLIAGIAKAMQRKIGYVKPLGDRAIYRKKRLWDYDAILIASILELTDNPEDMTIGFDHGKLRYMYNEAQTKEKLRQSIAHLELDKDILLIESGRDMTYGISVYLDAISVAEQIDGKLLIVVSGDEETILDDIVFIKKRVELGHVRFGGLIINKVSDVETFENTYLANITEMGLKVLGIIPYQAALTHFSVNYLADRLFAKVIAGEGGLNGMVQNIFVGAMSVNTALRNPALQKENTLIITSGDRTDMILAVLENNTAAIILTNNILPPPNIISKASTDNIPLLAVPADTYEVAKQIDNLQPLLTKDDQQKIDLLGELVRKHVNLKEIINH